MGIAKYKLEIITFFYALALYAASPCVIVQVQQVWQHVVMAADTARADHL